MFPSNNDLTFSPFSYNYNTNSTLKPFSINDDIFFENDPFDPINPINFPFFRFPDNPINPNNLENPETSFTRTQNTNQEQVLSTLPTMESNVKEAVLQRTKTRGGGKKDRHSKIKTVNGLRDRRMRLSLEVAREFFGLQDRLGFDKASKTVEWLLRQAKAEIKKLYASTTTHQEISTVETSKTKTMFSSSTVDQEKGVKSTNRKIPKDKKSVEKCRFRTVPKELRVKARERARERTKEKRRKELGESKITNNDLSYLCSSSNNRGSFETGEESRTQNVQNLPFSFQEFEEASQNNNQGEEVMMEESLDIMNKWSSLTIFNNATASLEHQYAELQTLLGKPNWEVYNTNQNFF